MVKSTLAAEAAAAAHAFDRVAMVKYLLSAMLYGEEDLWLNGAARLRGILVTDCMSLVDLLDKEGNIPTEKRIALDVADLREGLEMNNKLVWASTDKQLADALMKRLHNDTQITDMMRENVIDFTPTAKKVKVTFDKDR